MRSNNITAFVVNEMRPHRKSASDWRQLRFALPLLCAIAAFFGSCQHTSAADSVEAWEYSPYRISVWLAYDLSDPRINSRVINDIKKQVPLIAYSEEPCAWRVEVKDAAQAYRDPILNRLADFEFSDEEKTSSDVKKGDKIIMLGIKVKNRKITLMAREWDCPTEVWGPYVEHEVYSSELVPRGAYHTMVQAFVPVARLLQVEKKSGRAVPRAGGLTQCPGYVPFTFQTTNADGETEDVTEYRFALKPNYTSPVWMGIGDVFVPVMRRALRKKVDGKRISVVMTMDIEWTYALTESLDENDGEPSLGVTIYSAKRAPMGGATGRRTERILRKVKPQSTTTTLLLTNRKDPPEPLAGYEIFSVRPGYKASDLLGKTDWAGSFKVDQHEEYPLRVLYVRSGKRVLARLPMVPGYYPESSQKMFNDDIRIRAEGAVRGFENNLLDLIARRQTLKIQTEMALGKKDFKRAKSLIDDFAALKTGKDFAIEVASESRKFASKDPREQKKIDYLFSEINRLVAQKLKPSELSDLQVLLRETKEGKKPDPEPETESETDVNGG